MLSHIRTTDGFLTATHDVPSAEDGRHEVAVFNPDSNGNQESLLRRSTRKRTSRLPARTTGAGLRAKARR